MEIGDMKENVSGCFFLNTVYVTFANQVFLHYEIQ